MDNNLLENLLNEDESASLDFKRDQYPFSNVDDITKSELLKDILAFTNAWRRSDAYILVGVNEVQGGRSEIVGVSEHLSEASLQQFINSKTQRPISFSYEVCTVDNKSIGVIKIPCQQRPFYVEKDYGKVRANIVYLRRGSSTDIASPDEVAKMGYFDSTDPGLQAPTLKVRFANPSTQTSFGNGVPITSTVLKIQQPLPDYPLGSGSQFSLSDITSIGTLGSNKDYFREMAAYLLADALTAAVSLQVHNPSSVSARHVKLVCQIPKNERIRVYDPLSLPDRPRTISSIRVRSVFTPDPQIIVTNRVEDWLVTLMLDMVRPGETVTTTDSFYIGATNDMSITGITRIYADNLPDPITEDCTFTFTTFPRTVPLSELRHYASED